jgi:hypothetical protein
VEGQKSLIKWGWCLQSIHYFIFIGFGLGWVFKEL